ERSSTATTSRPRSRQPSTTCEPMKPAAPVTSARSLTAKPYWRRASGALRVAAGDPSEGVPSRPRLSGAVEQAHPVDPEVLRSVLEAEPEQHPDAEGRP